MYWDRYEAAAKFTNCLGHGKERKGKINPSLTSTFYSGVNPGREHRDWTGFYIRAVQKRQPSAGTRVTRGAPTPADRLEPQQWQD